MLDGWSLVARFVLGGMLVSVGALIGALGGYILKDAWEGSKAKAQAAIAAAGQSPAALLFKCEFAKLPSLVPPAGQVYTMAIMSKLEFGAEPWGISPRYGQPGEKWEWFKDNEISQVSRCDITNYADFPIFNIGMVFKQEFRAVVVSKDNPGAQSSGDVVDASDRTVVIDNIDAKSTFTFYAYSHSRYFVSVRHPTEVTYLKAGSDTRESAKILPSLMGGMSFGPKPDNSGPEKPAGVTVH